MTDAPAIAHVEGRIALPPSGLERVDYLLNDLLGTLSEILDVSTVRYDDINARRSGIVFVGWNKSQWGELPDDAAPLVGRAREALRRVSEFTESAAKQAPDRERELEALREAFSRVIEQPSGSHPGGAPASTIEGVQTHVEARVEEYRQVVRRLPSAHGSEQRLLIADTSALLDRPDLQEWRLDGEAWTVILLPQVLSELDDRKRDERTRIAAQKVINQIEDFDRRGDTFAGVPLAGKLAVREVPTSPDMTRTLPWLRADVPDDAIVAGALELLWHDLTSRVGITASDRNVRNKARLAGLGVVRPSDL